MNRAPYWGQCAEFCGLEHGRMRFRVVALDAAAWTAWVAHHREPAGEPTDALAREGMDLFLDGKFENGQCIACHAVGGTTAEGVAAPNLTHFADPTHECFAGCNWDTFIDGQPNLDDLKAWLRDPGAVKLGAKMPDYGLSEDEIDASRGVPVQLDVRGRDRGERERGGALEGGVAASPGDHRLLVVVHDGRPQEVGDVRDVGVRVLPDRRARGAADVRSPVRTASCSTPISTTRSSRRTASRWSSSS